MPAIKHKEIVEQGNPFDEALKGVIALEKQVKKSMNATVKETKKFYDSAKLGNIKIEEQTKEVDHLSNSYKKQKTILTEAQRLERAIVKEKEKHTAENRKLLKELKDQRQVTRRNIQTENTAKDSLERKRVVLAKLQQ